MNAKLEARYAGMFRRPPPAVTDEAFAALVIGVVTALRDQYGEAGATKYLNAALAALSKATDR